MYAGPLPLRKAPSHRRDVKSGKPGVRDDPRPVIKHNRESGIYPSPQYSPATYAKFIAKHRADPPTHRRDVRPGDASTGRPDPRPVLDRDRVIGAYPSPERHPNFYAQFGAKHRSDR